MAEPAFPDKPDPRSRFGSPPSEFWSDPFYSDRPAYGKPGPPGSFGYTLGPSNGSGGGGGQSGGGGDYGPPAPSPTPGAPVSGLPKTAAQISMDKLIGAFMALATGLTGHALAGNNTNAQIPPELLQLLAEAVKRQQQQGPLFDATTQGVFDMLPAFAKQGHTGTP